jgi:hypothetical protein
VHETQQSQSSGDHGCDERSAESGGGCGEGGLLAWVAEPAWFPAGAQDQPQEGSDSAQQGEDAPALQSEIIPTRLLMRPMAAAAMC